MPSTAWPAWTSCGRSWDCELPSFGLPQAGIELQQVLVDHKVMRAVGIQEGLPPAVTEVPFEAWHRWREVRMTVRAQVHQRVPIRALCVVPVAD